MTIQEQLLQLFDQRVAEFIAEFLVSFEDTIRDAAPVDTGETRESISVRVVEQTPELVRMVAEATTPQALFTNTINTDVVEAEPGKVFAAEIDGRTVFFTRFRRDRTHEDWWDDVVQRFEEILQGAIG